MQSCWGLDPKRLVDPEEFCRLKYTTLDSSSEWNPSVTSKQNKEAMLGYCQTCKKQMEECNLTTKEQKERERVDKAQKESGERMAAIDKHCDDIKKILEAIEILSVQERLAHTVNDPNFVIHESFSFDLGPEIIEAERLKNEAKEKQGDKE